MGDALRPLPWLQLKTIARLASDVRKHLVVAYPPPPGASGEVVEVKVDDAYARPAEAQAGKRRAPVARAAGAHAKRRRS